MIKNLKLITALMSIYVIWGSVYLAIKIAVQEFPPLLMSGSRFLIAGIILYIIAFFFGAPRPSKKEWFNAMILGTFLFMFGNGLVVIAEQTVDSGITAMLKSTEPLWMLIISLVLNKEKNSVSKVDIISLIFGFFGVIILLSNNFKPDVEKIDPFGVTLILISCISWSLGSFITAKKHVSQNPVQATGMKMISGGSIILILSLLRGEFSDPRLFHLSSQAILSQAFLIIFGSLVAFNAYAWLLRNASLTLASTYAFVNPLVAIILGVVFANEQLNGRIILSSIIIIISVILIIFKDKFQKMASDYQKKIKVANTDA